MLMVLLKLKVNCEEEENLMFGECQNLLREVEQNILPDREFTKKQKCEVNQVQCEQMYLAQHLYSIERIPDAYGAPKVCKK